MRDLARDAVKDLLQRHGEKAGPLRNLRKEAQKYLVKGVIMVDMAQGPGAWD